MVLLEQLEQLVVVVVVVPLLLVVVSVEPNCQYDSTIKFKFNSIFQLLPRGNFVPLTHKTVENRTYETEYPITECHAPFPISPPFS